MTNKAYVSINEFGTAQLSDSFDEGTLNGSLWTSYASGSGFSVAVADSELQCTLAGSVDGYAGIWSNGTYDLTGTSAQVQFAATGDATNGGDTTNMAFILATSQGAPAATIAVSWILSQDVIYAGYQTTTSGDSGANVASASWSSDYTYLRIRESSGTTYWDSSPDGTTWTNRASISDPVTLTALHGGLYGWNYASGGGSTLGFSNFSLGADTPVCGASAVIVSPENAVVASPGNGLPLTIFAPVTYGNSEEDIREAVVTAVQTAADDDTLDVSIVG